MCKLAMQIRSDFRKLNSKIGSKKQRALWQRLMHFQVSLMVEKIKRKRQTVTYTRRVIKIH